MLLCKCHNNHAKNAMTWQPHTRKQTRHNNLQALSFWKQPTSPSTSIWYCSSHNLLLVWWLVVVAMNAKVVMYSYYCSRLSYVRNTRGRGGGGCAKFSQFFGVNEAQQTLQLLSSLVMNVCKCVWTLTPTQEDNVWEQVNATKAQKRVLDAGESKSREKHSSCKDCFESGRSEGDFTCREPR